MKRISFTTQNKLILAGLIISTALIMFIAFFAIINIQEKLDSSYTEFGKMMSKTLAVESSEIAKDYGEYDIYDKISKNIKSLLQTNKDIAYIEFKTNDGEIIYSSKNDFPNRALQTRITVSSPMIIENFENAQNTSKVIGAAIIGLSGHTIQNISKTTRNSMLIVFFVAWIVFTITVLINTILITRELNTLQMGVKNISGGHFGYKIDIKGVSGELKQLVEAFNDMSGRLNTYEKQNIEQLTLERNKFEAVLMSIANGVVVCDNYDNVVLINNAAQKLLDVDPQLINSTKIQQYCDSDGNLCFKEKIEQFKDTPLDIMEKKPLEFNIEIDKRVLKAVISPMFSKSQDYLGYIIVLIDVTKEVEIDKMKSSFISNVSHELRTPVTVLRTYADTLYNHSSEFDEETKNEFLATLNKETDHLHRMVNEILDFSRLESPNIVLHKEFCDINTIIESSIDSMQILAEEKGLHFSVLKEDNLPNVFINVQSIERALKNLISNAIKYSNNNDKIKIRAEVSKDPQYLEISVIDNGMGIEEKHLSKIFDRFYRVENATHSIKGTGLGLHLVKISVEKHNNGFVKVKSKINEGSTFSILLPTFDTTNLNKKEVI